MRLAVGNDEGQALKPRRVVKAPAVRREELIDCAQRLFLAQGYEKTTINDVIAATGLSKGAFYHHFRSKEDLLAAITERFARESLAFVTDLRADRALNALQRLNALLALGRDWKLEHIRALRAMFTTLLRPENAMLYHRIVEAAFNVLAPALAAIIEQGAAEGLFDVGDPRTAADTLLWLGNGRRPIVMQGLTLAETDVEAGLTLMLNRVRAEEAIIDRILGLKPGSVDVIGSVDDLRAMVVAWTQA
jgi:AcrR family transcriptional regulator